MNVPAEPESEPESESETEAVKKSIENAILDYVTEFQQLIYESEHMLLNTNTVLQKNQINLNRQVAINQDHINERQVAMHNYLYYLVHLVKTGQMVYYPYYFLLTKKIIPIKLLVNLILLFLLLLYTSCIPIW